MTREQEYERLLNDLERCLSKAQALQLEFAPELIKMTFLEVSNCRAAELTNEVAAA